MAATKADEALLLEGLAKFMEAPDAKLRPTEGGKQALPTAHLDMRAPQAKSTVN